MSEGPPPILTVAAAKGGVGKSTLTVNLAHCWGMLGIRTLIIDLDPQGSATRFLANTYREENTNRLSSLKSRDAIVRELEALRAFSLPTERSVVALLEGKAVEPLEYHGVGIIGFHPNGTARMGSLGDMKTQNAFLDALDTSIRKYAPQVVIIDTPPSNMDAAVFAVNQATHVLIPLEATEEGLRGALVSDDQRLEAIKHTRRRTDSKVFDIKLVGVVPMDVYRSTLCTRIIEAAHVAFPGVVTQQIDHAATIGEACTEGLPVIAYEAKMKNLLKEYQRKGVRFSKSGMQLLTAAQTVGVNLGILTETAPITPVDPTPDAKQTREAKA